MGMKLIQTNENQPAQKQLNDMRKNLEIIAKQIDGMLNRIVQLESNQMDGGITLISK